MRKLFAFIFLCPVWAFAQNSVLSTGEWVKIGITQSGIYQIDAAFLSDLGWDPSSINPESVQIFGNGIGMLPQQNQADRPIDLNEVSIKLLNDGNWKLLAYLKGPDEWNKGEEGWEFIKNIYSDTAYFFITHSQSDQRSIEASPAPEELLTDTYTSYTHLQAHELDETNLLTPYPSGRIWYETIFTGNEKREYNFSTDRQVGAGSAFVSIVGRCDLNGSFTVDFNGEELGQIEYESVNVSFSSTYDIKGDPQTATFEIDANENTGTIGIRLDEVPGNEQLFGYLDQIVVSYERELVLDDQPLLIPLEENGSYGIAGTSELLAWDVSDQNDIKELALLSADNLHWLNHESDEIRNIAIFDPASATYPTSHGRVANQNIRSLSPSDGVIITHPDFLAEAERLADFHRSHDQLDVDVVQIHEVYNEFSSGMQDITAVRDLIRHYWNKKTESFKYAVLFGDCSYDYKDRIAKNTNFIPIYESRNSIDPVETYSSDDFFGFMEDNEGYWEETYSGDHTLEVGIGRLPVTNREEANDVVNKIIRYATSERAIGDWKNNMTYVVDDGDGNRHVSDAERLSSYFSRYIPRTNLQKLYIDAQPQTLGASKERAPLTQELLINALEEGTFMVNYIGHGSETQWAEEQVLTMSNINSLTNRVQLPVFVTATCEFGRYDNPTIFRSGAEALMLNPNGGAIALLTTTRPVYASTNYLVNAAFHSYLFEKIDGEYPRLGDVVRQTKNASLSGEFNRNFSLLGDPMLRLQYPSKEIKIDEINGLDFHQNSTDTLSALEKIQFSGSVYDLNNQVDHDFEGVVEVAVFDRKTEKLTLGQQSNKFPYTVQENTLFKGLASVEAGQFNIEFILPKHISYGFDPGKVVMYAYTNEGTLDASGSTTNISIGGSIDRPGENLPPEVQLFINDSSFVNGGTIGSNSILLARVSDESGINTSGLGVSQDITLIIDGKEQYVLNDYYQADLDTYTTGTISFPLRDLEIGRHTAELKVWDLHNNSTVTTVDFVVSDQPQIRLYNLANYPNPAWHETTIRFEHDRQGEELKIKLQVYDMMGSVMMTEEFEIDDSPQMIDDIHIDLPKGKLRNGVYLYRVDVMSTLDHAEGYDVGRLLIIN